MLLEGKNFRIFDFQLAEMILRIFFSPDFLMKSDQNLKFAYDLKQKIN